MVGAAAGVLIALAGSKIKRAGPPAGTHGAHTLHEAAAHGVGGAAVGDPDAPPRFPEEPVDSRIEK